MEERAVQQEKIEGSWEGGHDAGKADWKNECSLSSLLKHSCLLCWSSPRNTDVVETDERVLAKATEIRELENAVAVENLELQEQQSDRKELEETLVKLETHKETLLQQIKATRQLCYEESQQILSLQAEEVQKESQVEEYERELARVRWRLKRLRDEVKLAKRKVEEAGERDTPLQDSIRQSYEEILQEEHTLYSLSGGAVTPESQLEESASPADTTEDDPLPMRPWGRSQSLPAYADLIMRASGSSFCNNLANTREEADDSGTSSPKMDRSDIEDDLEEGAINNEGEKEREMEESTVNPNPLSQLDFYQADPFAHCQSDHDLFNEDLFPKTDSSGGFASDPFKGSDPFAADILFPDANIGTDDGAGNVGDEADTSLSCAENKASTGTQCFESEFPDEDSDIEISYSREDLDAIAVVDDSCGFKPIQSSSEELGPEPIQGWRSHGQYSIESDPNGYELDLGTVSPPSDIEEQSLGSLAGGATTEATAGLEQGLGSGSAPAVPELDKEVLMKPNWAGDIEQTVSCYVTSSQGAESVGNIEEEPQNPVTPQNSLDSQNLFIQPDTDHNRELSFELSYEQTSQSSFDPYGFKLSPEHSSHTLLDPDEVELSPEPSENDLNFDPEPSSSQSDQLNIDCYGFDITSSQMVRDSDPYGFKLSPEEENQEVLDLCGHDNQEAMDLCTYDNNEQIEPCYYSNQEVLEPHTYENQEVLEHCSHNNEGLLDLCNNGNQELLEPSSLDNAGLVSNENQEFLDLCSHDNQEVVEPHCNITSEELLEPCNYDNQEVLEPCRHGNRELLDFSSPENLEVLDSDSHGDQDLVDFGSKENLEVLDSDSHGDQDLLDFGSKENEEVLVSGSHGNQELLDLGSNENQELLDLGSHDNQEVLDLLSKDVFPEANNNQCIVEPELDVSSTTNSSDSDVASEDLLGLELSYSSICTTNQTNTNTADTPNMAVSNMSANQDIAPANAPTSRNLLEGDLGSVFGAGGYIGCPDVADDLEPLERRPANPVAEPVRPVRPVRPPRPSLMAKEKAQSQTQGVDLK
ncbi:dentin sialophosphoprotein-like isoform X2 [Sander lucioperca]|uniref:dentin sialophosphoprotein-like isoform X2 n=1 Tax=Sander lucioperca TaxID=283035 RepID=UPI00125E97C0|nr:dentin sialophosphoprotein-like isoform X2 [Sander lucioperca]